MKNILKVIGFFIIFGIISPAFADFQSPTPIWETISIPVLPSGAHLYKGWIDKATGEVFVLVHRDITGSDESYLYHWNGTSWNQELYLPGYAAYWGDVWGTSISDIYLSIHDTTIPDPYANKMMLFHYDGNAWTQQLLPPPFDATGLWNFVGEAGNVYGAGTAPNSGPIAIGVNRGSGWQFDSYSTDIYPNAMTYISANEIYMVGCWGHMLWNGVSWGTYKGFDFCDIYDSWGMRDANGDLHLYAAGNNNYSNGIRVWKFTESYKGSMTGTWGSKYGTFFSDPPSGYATAGTANGVWGSAPDDIYVVGRRDNGSAIYHFDGTSFTRLLNLGDIGPNANDVFGTDRTDVWITGSNGNILRYHKITCIDADNDGYSTTGGVCGPVDCDDNNNSINPGASEFCGNSVDDNCNGQIDEACNTDLSIPFLSAPLTAVPGDYIMVSDSTKNQGTTSGGASTTNFYWSANALLDSSDVLIGSRSVPSLIAGAISSGSTSLSIPAPLTCSGLKIFYIKAKADAGGVIAESDETNNKRNRSIKMGPDLIIPVFTTAYNASAGKTIIINDTTMNLGGCTAGTSTTKFYLSADTILDASDTLLGSRSVPSLTSGAISSGSTAVIIPAGKATGKYYILAWSDADNVVAETNEGNNKKVRTINIVPDLIVSILSAPNTASAGATITISDTTKNIGGSTAAASTTKFYLSTNTTFDIGDTLLGSRSIPSLTAGATNSGGTSVTIPTGTTSGAYYIIGRADADTVVAETNESNNNKYRLITVP